MGKEGEAGRVVTFRRILWLWIPALLLGMLAGPSCKRQEAPGPVSMDEVRFRKVVVWIEQGVLHGRFSIENEKQQQLAMSGRLTLECSLMSSVSVDSGGTFDVNSPVFHAELPVKTGDFQWIYHHSFLTEDDYVYGFRVPLSAFDHPPPAGRYIRFKILFKPDAVPGTMEMEKLVWVPE